MKYLLAFLLLCLSLYTNAQDLSIEGTIKDESGQLLPGALVQLEHPWEEIIQSAVSSNNGQFKFESCSNGGYKIRIQFLGYETKLIECTLTNESLNLGTVILKKDALKLKAFELQEKAPMATQSGDTTSYNASAFKTLKDANSGDLLEKMPGITNSNGELQAQGERVEKVLVDGKPFFGNNPKTALQTLPAEVVEKIQVYDEKSEQSQFTGFDDGETIKTINIVTKKSSRNGQFGKVYGGIGNEGKYKVGGNGSYFNGDQRISLIGQSNNINIQNFSSEDLLGISGSGKGRRGGKSWGRSGNSFTIPQQDGIAQTHAIGFNYNDQFNEKMQFSASYFGNQSSTTLEENTQRYFLNQLANQEYDEDYISESNNGNHRINMELRYKIDSLNTLSIRPSISFQNNSELSTTLANTQSLEQQINDSYSSYDSGLSGLSFSGRAFWSHRFPKNRHSFSLSVTSRINENDGLSYQNSQNNFYIPIPRENTINQETNFTNTSNSLKASASYNIPYQKTGMFSFTAFGEIQEQNMNNFTYSYADSTEAYEILEPQLSGENKYQTNTQGGSLGYRYRKGRNAFFMARLRVQQAILQGDQLSPISNQFEKSFNAVLPFAMAKFTFSKTENLRIFYRTSADLPSGNQLNYVLDNNNPVQLSIGNPDLEQAMSHRIFFRYQKTDAEKANLFFANLNVTHTRNYIGTQNYLPGSQAPILDALNIPRAAQLTQYQNLEGYWNVSSFLTYGLPLSKIRSNLNFNINAGYSKIPGLINELETFSHNTNSGLGWVLSSNLSETLDFTLSSTTSLNWINNSLLNDLDANFINQSSNLKLAWVHKESLVIRTKLNHQLYSGLSDEFNQNFLLWTASIGTKLFKNKRGEIALEVFDILNQNQALNRQVTELYYEDVQTNVLQRFLMLNFTYNFRNFNSGKAPSKQQRGFKGPPGRF